MSKSSGKPLSLPPLKTILSTPSLKTLIKKYRTSSDSRWTLRCIEFLESVSIGELYRSNYDKTPYDTDRVNNIEILIIPEINVELYCRVLFRNSSYFHRLERAILIEASVKDDRSRKIIKYLFKSETIKELEITDNAPIDINVVDDSEIVEIMRSNIIMDEIKIKNPNPRSNFEFLRHLNIHYTHVTISDVEDSNRSFCETLRNMKTLRAFFLRIRFKETANFTYLSRRNISEYLSVVRNQNLTSFALTFDFFDYYSPDVLNFFREELSLRSKPLENFQLLVDDLSNSKEELGLGISSIIKLDKIHNIDLNLRSDGQPMIMTPDLREPIIEAMRNCKNFHGVKGNNLNLDDGAFPYLRHLTLRLLTQRYHPSLMKTIIKRFPSLEKLVIEEFVERPDDIGLNIQDAYGNIKHLEIKKMTCHQSVAG